MLFSRRRGRIARRCWRRRLKSSVTPADERVAGVRCEEGRLVVDLADGRSIAVPLAWYPRLLAATPEQRANWTRAGGGYGIRWPDIDEDLSTEALLRGAPAPDAGLRRSDAGPADDVTLVTHFDSSAIERARYSPDRRTLDIWYKGGDRYSYFDVAPEAYVELRSAKSASEYVNRHIKPHHRYEIEGPRRRFRPG